MNITRTLVLPAIFHQHKPKRLGFYSSNVNRTWTRYFYDDFTVGKRMIPPGVGQSKLTVSVPHGTKCSAEVHYWVADKITTGNN